MPKTPLPWIFKTRYRNAVAAVIFILAVLLITRFDYFYHSDLYSYGLVFDENWYWTYQVLYFLTWQVLVWILFLYHRSKLTLGFYQAFVLTGCQDIVYFAVWNMMQFPAGDWTWMLQYRLLGFWTTEMHLLTCFLSLAIYGAAAAVYKKGKRK